MKNKGFTLIELLATVFIMALVLGLVVFGVTNLLSEKSDEAFEDSKKGIRSAARTYVGANADTCELKEEETIYVCLKSLIDYGYYNKVTKIKGNNAECDGYISLKQNKAGSAKELIEVETYLKCGDYEDVPDGKTFDQSILNSCQSNTKNSCLKN